MSKEDIIFDTLKGLVGNRCYPDVAPVGVLTPYITYQQVGGTSINFLDPAVPSAKFARFQINVWSKKRSDVSSLAIQIEDLLRAVTALQPTVDAAPVSVHEPTTGLFGSHQDFTFFS